MDTKQLWFSHNIPNELPVIMHQNTNTHCGAPETKHNLTKYAPH
jgi:hypothetical protein